MNAQSSWIALRYPKFRAMFVAEFLLNCGSSMGLAAVGWHIWKLTGDELALGLVGLVRVIPIVILALLGGVIADAMDRRRLLLISYTGFFVSGSLLALTTLTGSVTLQLVYLLTALNAGISAFVSPAWAALMPTLLPKEHLAHGARMNSLMFPITFVLGPVFSGFAISFGGPGAAYLLAALTIVPAILVLARLDIPTAQVGGGLRDVNLKSMVEGLRFVWSKPELRGSMLLDFFATFFSSAMALLPIYASDILKVGAEGYGVLYASPAIGSIVGAMLIAQLGGRLRRQGEIMLIAVGFYGVATVIFGISTTFVVSLIALGLTGFADAVSTMVRATMRQLLTPDRLRGRMLSVNMIFFMGGPQLGEFEAGLLARLTTVELSVVTGGVGTVIVVALMALTLPALRNYRESNALAEQMRHHAAQEMAQEVAQPAAD